MEEKITKELKKIHKMTESLERKYNKSLKPNEIEILKSEIVKLHTQLARLDERFKTYMEVFKMIKGEEI